MHFPAVVARAPGFFHQLSEIRGKSLEVLKVPAHLEKDFRGPRANEGQYDQSEARGLSRYAPEDR